MADQKRLDAKKLVEVINLNDNDKRTFQTFQPLGKLMETHKGAVLLTAGVGTRSIQDKDYTELTLKPENGEGIDVKVTLAYDSRNIFVGDKSLSDIGRDGAAEDAVANLASFEVKEVTFTGEYPWKRSRAAEVLGFVDKDEMTNADWTALREKYEANPEMRNAADGVSDIFEISKIEITPVQ